MDNNKYNLDNETLEICKIIPKIDVPPSEIRSQFSHLYKKDIEKYAHKVFKFEMPKEVDNGEAIDCLFYYPDDYKQDELLPVILYIHGGGFIVDGLKKLPSDLSKLTRSVVVYPCYSLAPESKYPISLEQCYNVLLDLKSNRYQLNNLDTNLISLFGESAGGAISTSISILLKQRQPHNNSIIIQNSVMLYSILNDDLETNSYNTFKDGFYLTKHSMTYCFGHYLGDPSHVNQVTCCPLKGTVDQLSNLPVLNTLIITAECDVLRDENEQYALKLSQSNKNIQCYRFNSVIHGFLAFDTLIDSKRGQLGLKVISTFINKNINKSNNNQIEYDNLIKDLINNKSINKIV